MRKFKWPINIHRKEVNLSGKKRKWFPKIAMECYFSVSEKGTKVSFKKRYQVLARKRRNWDF